jgi:hypothetical protein
MTEVVTPAATPAAPVAQPETTAVPGAEAKPEVPERTFSQKELDDIVEKRLAKERRKREELKTRLKVTEELALRAKPPEPERKPARDDEPKRDQFDTYEAFIEARAEWRADKKVEERFNKEREEQKNRTAKEQDQKRVEAFQKRTRELAKSLEDFDEVMAAATADPESAVARLLADPIDECDNPAAVLYHLAKNADEAERIASLPAGKQAREIWALDTRLKSAPEPKKPSKAPEPINPVGGKTAQGDAEPDASDTKAWIAWRNRQIAAKARGA